MQFEICLHLQEHTLMLVIGWCMLCTCVLGFVALCTYAVVREARRQRDPPPTVPFDRFAQWPGRKTDRN